jgi:hypothetical protein
LGLNKLPNEVIVQAKELGESKYLEGQLRFQKSVVIEEKTWCVFGCSI